MLREHSTLFMTKYKHIQGVHVIKHHIRLKEGSKSVAQKLRTFETVQQTALLMEVKKLLEAWFIYLVEDLEWVLPMVVTSKKNGNWQVCVDYKPLNVATKQDHFPLHFQDEILNLVSGHERYTVCDGNSDYFQIRIAKEDHHLHHSMGMFCLPSYAIWFDKRSNSSIRIPSLGKMRMSNVF